MTEIGPEIKKNEFRSVQSNMTDAHPSVLLQLQQADLPGRTPFCPDDQQVAEYFDGGLDGAEKVGLERHFDECRHCRARIGVIERVLTEEGDRRIPGEVLAAAKGMVEPVRSRRFRTAPAWAAAALLVVTLAALVNDRLGTPQATAEPGQAGTDTRQVRSVSPETEGIRVLNPAHSAEMRPGSTFEWTAVPDSLHYDVFVLTGEGDVVVVERVRQTDWVLDPAQFDREDGTYYFRVVAFLPDGRKLQSRHVPFELQWE